MGKPLIIVESPAKARSMSKYLGGNFTALASYGHVRDLVPKPGAVIPEQDFAMKYAVIERNEKHVNAIAKAMRTASALYLATDPDREGEAIAWHLCELLKARDVIGTKPVHRVVFHEITATAIRAAVENPRQLSTHLIDAQQARRALDYLVGFNLSPLLWRKMRYGLSAGRVQSPALRLICEREAEIEKFERQEYWSILAKLNAHGQDFSARLSHFDNQKLAQFSIPNQARATEMERALTEAAQGRLLVAKVRKNQRKRNPTPPFTTSTLQQEASRKLGFTTKRTMQVAQQLYEGVDLGDGASGLITYMRTDSVALSSEAVREIRALIKSRYGNEALPTAARVFKNKTKNAQEAHEAVRPTQAAHLPTEIKSFLSDEQYKLYDLIWKRAVASQMQHAVIDTVSVDLNAGQDKVSPKGVFRASGSTVRSPGFMLVYTEGRDDAKGETAGESTRDAERENMDEKEVTLPPLREGEMVALREICPNQHFTEPPPRYNEATLVKTLEEYGIGRPSTYASIISTLLNREYAVLEKRRFEPTEIGKLVNLFLCKHFQRYIDYEFTARLEDTLDEVSRGETSWLPVMRQFWEPFSKRVQEKDQTVSRDEAINARELGTDPKSGKPVSVRMGRYGPFVQIGTRDDEEKPKFASLLTGQKMDRISFEEAMALFRLPRSLGETAEGEKLTVAIGRFGPYVRYGDKFVSLKDHDPYTVGREVALALVAEKKQADANRVILNFADAGIQVLNGRYGPYITDGIKTANVPKHLDEPKQLTLGECQELLKDAKPSRWALAKAAKKKGAKKKAANKKKTVAKKKSTNKKAKK